MWIIGLLSLLVLTCGLIYAIVQLRQDYNARFIKLSALNKVLQQENSGYATELERIRKTSSWYNKLFNASENIVLVFALDTDNIPANILDVNDLACLALGYTREELLGMTPLDIQMEQDAIPSLGFSNAEMVTTSDQVLSGRRARFYTRETRVLVERILEKDELTYSGIYITRRDQRIPVEISARSLVVNGRTIIVSSAHDITGEKQTQNALNESEHRFRNFFRQSPIGLAIYDAERNLNDANPACLRIFGCPTIDEFRKLNMFSNPFIPPEASKMIDSGASAQFEAAFDFNRVRKEAMFVSSRSGECHYDILITSLGHDTSYRNRGYVTQVQDITERKKTEQALLQSEKMLRQAEKMEAIGSMAGGIAHDFNNILTPLLGYAEIALRSVNKESPMSNYIEEILRASHRAKDLVDQILSFSRKNEKEGQPIHLLPIVKEVLTLIKTSAPETMLIDRIIKTERDVVKADPTQMHQVFMNLCTNAIHAMKNAEPALLEVRVTDFLLDNHYRTELPNLKPGRYLRVSVKDSGTGMDQATMEKIFEPFFTTKGKGEGTGLGLAVVHSIIASCGGRITVESLPGKGATFNVILPLLEDQLGAVIADSVAPLPTGKETILIIDDEPEIVEMIATMLGTLGYHPVFSKSSSDALEKFRVSPSRYDLIIVDQVMPGMSGSQLALEIMMINPSTPVILCTGFTEVLSEEELLAMGIRQILKKPIVMKELATAVRNTLDGKPAA